MNEKLKKDYIESQKFWDETLSKNEPYKIDETWITSDKVLEIFNKYVNENSHVLDYGTGSGWAIEELYLRRKFIEGIAIDTSENTIALGNKCLELSNINNIKFICGDQHVLDDYKDHFDYAMSFNVLDVVPDEITYEILERLAHSMKKDGYIFIGLNHDFSTCELTNMLNMTQEGNYFYKNGILRANKKTKEEWYELLSNYFTIVERFEFALVESEEKYPRLGYLLKK